MQTQKGFTLVELSIVLIIIGLIISGVVTGKSLIEAAQIRAQVNQLQDYNKAYHTFKLKYDDIPGDMANASDYWAGVTDGDGNGRVGLDSDWGVFNSEVRGFFWHLSSSKLVKGDFDGTGVIGQGYPRLKVDTNKGLIAGSAIYSGPSGIVRNGYQLTSATAGKVRTAAVHLEVSLPDVGASGYNEVIGTMSVLETYTIDNKIDDSKANSGLFQSFRTYLSTQGDCLTGNDGDYLMTEPDNMACHALYILEK